MKSGITGLIIAAGFSSRMGKFKPLLEYQNKSFLLNIISKLNSVCNNLVVVTGYNKELLEQEIESISSNKRIKIVFNKAYKDEMFMSLQTGLRETTNSDWVLYHFIDQPNLPILFYKDFIAQIDYSFDWIQPKYKGKKGHPILLGKKVINEILSSDSTSNLKQISEINNFKKKIFDVNSKSILSDIDTKADYDLLIAEK